MSTATLEQLDRFGPARCESMPVEAARAWCRRLARTHYENFSVLSPLVPREKRDDFAAVYAFCRWADDLGDETGSTAKSLELLSWWREELRRCYESEPRHPVFVALAPTIQAYDIPMQLFDDLIRAFEQDQTLTRYQTWDQLLDYCRLSANPVGRLVLMMSSGPRDDETLAASDAICTALQLTNHWQDVQRDLIERDRIYIPTELSRIADFENRLRRSAACGHAIDRTFLPESRSLIRACVERTWPLFESGRSLLPRLDARTRPIVWLFIAGGMHILRQIEMWNYETVLHRPKLGAATKGRLIAQAWLSLQWAIVRSGKKG